MGDDEYGPATQPERRTSCPKNQWSGLTADDELRSG